MYLHFMLLLSACSVFLERQALPRVGLGPFCRHWLCIAWSSLQGQGLHVCSRTEMPFQMAPLLGANNYCW